MRILQQDPNNEVAFFWYVDTLPTDEERARLLQRFLRAHPNHEKAKVALRSIQVRIETRGGFLPDLEAEGKPAAPASPPSQPIQSAPPKASPVIEAQRTPPSAAPISPPAEEAVLPPTAPLKPVQAAAAPAAKADTSPPPLKAETAAPKPEDFAPPYRPLSPPKKEKSNLVAAITIVLIILLVAACAVVSLVKGIKDNPAFKSPAQRYAGEMATVMNSLAEWINGPVNQWGQAMSEEIYEGRTTQEVFQMNQQMGYVDVLVAEKLLPIANEIGMGGLKIDNAMSKITPPPEIENPHNQILLCVRYERTWADEMIGFLERNEPIELGENPCDTFLEAYRQLNQYIEKNK